MHGGGLKVTKKYIFIFLSAKNNDARDKIYFFAHKNGYAVLEWSPVDDRLASKTGPAEWLNIVHNIVYIFNIAMPLGWHPLASFTLSLAISLLASYLLHGVQRLIRYLWNIKKRMNEVYLIDKILNIDIMSEWYETKGG